MPFMDGTGPLGNGPGSGRGRGRCATGNGGGGRRMRFGRRLGLSAAQDPKARLAQEVSILEAQLDRIKRRISEQGGEQGS